MNYTYRIYPDAMQQAKLLDWLETCRGVYNYALRELKDWIASRKCLVDKCSLQREYIIPALSSSAKQPAQSEEAVPTFGQGTLSGFADYSSQIARYLGSISQTGTRVPAIQKVWSIQVLCVPPVQT